MGRQKNEDGLRERVIPSQARPGDRIEIRLPGGQRMAFRFIPPGVLRMGQRGGRPNEEAVHRAVIPAGFWLAETPVTQAQFAAWKPEHKNHYAGRADHPAESMTWDEAREYCEWLTTACAADVGEWRAELPDEARWEYACRAGTETEYYSGDGEAALAEVGWYGGNAGRETHAVGGKPENGWGLYDMHGNVWEWCVDVYDGRAYRKRADGWVAQGWTTEQAAREIQYWCDPDMDLEGAERVSRGGSWDDRAGDCRAAVRYAGGPFGRAWTFGFRVCLARSRRQETGGQDVGGAGRGNSQAVPIAAPIGCKPRRRRCAVR